MALQRATVPKCKSRLIKIPTGDEGDATPEKAEENIDAPELPPAAAEDGDGAADEDADDATPEKAASDDDAPKPAQKIPNPAAARPRARPGTPTKGGGPHQKRTSRTTRRRWTSCGSGRLAQHLWKRTL